MSEYKRMTTDNPKSSTEAMLNYAYVEDGEVHLRYGNGEENIRLCDYISECAGERDCERTPQEVLNGACSECDCDLAILNAVAIQAAELRDRLAELEDKLESGRLVELPCKVGDTIYYVEYFCKYKGCSADTQTYCCGCKEMIERERQHEKYVIAEKKFTLEDLPQIGKKYFINEYAAETRLKELQEGKK